MASLRLASRLQAAGIPPKPTIVIVISTVSAALVASFPNQPWLPPVSAGIAALGALIDPNPNHKPPTDTPIG